MNIKSKQRIIGSLVLIAIVAIFLPILLHSSRPKSSSNTIAKIPAAPMQPNIQLELPAPNQPQEKDNKNLALANLKQSQPKLDKVAIQPKQSPPLKNATITAISQPKPMTTIKKSQEIRHVATDLNALPKAWVVQIGSFSNKVHVTELLTKLRQHGFDAYSRQVDLHNNHYLVRVFVGPEITLRHAKQLQASLRKEFKLSGVIRRYKL